jgi:hypothetical protein
MYFLSMHNILLRALILNFSLTKSRLECLAGMIISLIENFSVKRIYRFFRDQIFNYDQVAKFILNIFSSDNYVIALDRTCWKFGKSDINILFLVIIFGKISVPMYWHQLRSHEATAKSQLGSSLQPLLFL